MIDQNTRYDMMVIPMEDIFGIDVLDLPNEIEDVDGEYRLSWFENERRVMAYPVKKRELREKLTQLISAGFEIGNLYFSKGKVHGNTVAFIYVVDEAQGGELAGRMVPNPGDSPEVIEIGDYVTTHNEYRGFYVNRSELMERFNEIYENPEYKVFGLYSVENADDLIFIRASHRGTYVSKEDMDNEENVARLGQLYPRVLPLRSGYIFDADGEMKKRTEGTSEALVKDEGLAEAVRTLVSNGNRVVSVKPRDNGYQLVKISTLPPRRIPRQTSPLRIVFES